jgi:hypothetical protein
VCWMTWRAVSGRPKRPVYDASVHYWHVSRPLQKPGTRQHLVASSAAVVEALKKVAGHEVGPAIITGHVIGCHLPQDRRVQRALDDVASNIMRHVIGCRCHSTQETRDKVRW